ncbi:GT2 family glycosyltransferase [Motilibacter peucedani]|uniref:GT2 family glycosyltransferase n=1 Tax=Motilibacter peucedani TaxID=598650 RepID=A0A420XLZ6_9ACTN|nr:glycosyltransferase family 2 protein [Motilibacter peucedani]RKS71328.1 GT2 family glycosyltransferase [Motilibacter peucedani]
MTQTPELAEPAGSDWPAVSVVVPTVDRPEWMKRAVEAIIGQDYPGTVECIVVFDGTEPRLPEVELPEGRTLRAAVNTRTRGLAGNRNSGYLVATGELVCACDDDDEWMQGKLTAQVRLMQASPSASACVTGIVIAHEGRELERRAPAHPLELSDMLRDRHIEIHPSAFMVSREHLLSDIGLVDEEIPGGYGEDYEWLLRAARVGPIVSVPEPYVRVYWHDSSFFVSKWDTIEKALTYLLERFPEFETEPAGLARVEGQLAFASAAMGQRRKAVSTAVRSLRRSRTPKQSYAALLVASRLVSADRVVTTARRFGHGI